MCKYLDDKLYTGAVLTTSFVSYVNCELMV